MAVEKGRGTEEGTYVLCRPIHLLGTEEKNNVGAGGMLGVLE